MAKRKLVTILSRKADAAIYRAIHLSAELRDLRIKGRRLVRVANNSNGQITSVTLGKILSSSQDLMLAAEALRKEVKKWREEVAHKRLKCRNLFKSYKFRAEFINCQLFTWREALHSCLYRRVEAVLFNFDYVVHGEALNVVSKEFENEFRFLLDTRTKSVSFKRRFSQASK